MLSPVQRCINTYFIVGDRVERMPSNTTVATYGLGGALGLLVMAWASQAYLWYGYQRANPTVGTISTTPGFEFFIAVLFVIGAVIAFTAFSRGLAHALGTEW